MVKEKVSIVRCRAETSEAEIIKKTEEAIALIGGPSESFKKAKKILLKANVGIDRLVLTKGRQTELTEPAVVEGVVRALREVTAAEIILGDTPGVDDPKSLYAKLGYYERLSKYPNVRIVDFGETPYVEVSVPDKPLMFHRYWFHKELAEVDASVSVCKMKAHASMGCTLCIKNLFGLAPREVYGNPRQYLHDRLIRLPRVLVDIANIFKPSLNVVDGIMTANYTEWHGAPIETGVLIAGHNIVATDAVGMMVMGFEPTGDFPNHPHWYRQNSIKLAAGIGIGPNDANQIEILGVDPNDVKQNFEVKPYGAGLQARYDELKRGAATVAQYIENQNEYLDRFSGKFVAFRNDSPLWIADRMQTIMEWERKRCKDYTEYPEFVIRVTPEENEPELLEAYAEWA